MSWNPFRRNKDSQPDENTGTEPDTDRIADDDDTDQFATTGGFSEEATEIELDAAEAGHGLVRVRVNGSTADSFRRVSVSDNPERARQLEQLWLALPEERTGFGDLLVQEGADIAARFPDWQWSLADVLAAHGVKGELVAGVVSDAAQPPFVLRLRELLRELAEVAELLADIHGRCGWGWPEPAPGWLKLAVAREADATAALALQFAAWHQLRSVDEAAAASALAALADSVLAAVADLPHALPPGAEQFIAHARERIASTSEEGTDYTRLREVLAGLAAVPLALNSGGVTDTGRVREHNEDAWLVQQIRQQSAAGLTCHLVAVADGMGGHAAGEVASSLALDMLRHQLQMTLLAPRTKPRELSRLGEDITNIIRLSGQQIMQAAELEPERSGMGTTLAGFAAVAAASTVNRAAGGWHAVLFNVGDSRVYLYSCGRLLRLTRDHSLVQELVDSGEITAEEAFDHPRKNVISRCLGGGSIGSEPDVASYDPGPGELLLIASDGLGDMLRDHEIEALVREQVAAAGPAGLAQALVDAANAAGGKDNVTVVAAVWAPVG